MTTNDISIRIGRVIVWSATDGSEMWHVEFDGHHFCGTRAQLEALSTAIRYALQFDDEARK